MADSDDRRSWWRAPERLDRRAVDVLIALALLQLAISFLGSVTTQVMAYVEDDFGVGNAAQGTALAIIRADLFVALPLSYFADRVGRRRMLMITAVGGVVLSALCGLAPTMATFTAGQVVARGFVTAAAIITGILLIEEMPAGSRGWAATLYILAGVGGTAATLVIPPVVDGALGRWRWFYIAPIVSVPIIIAVVRRLPETVRFVVATAAGDDGTVSGPRVVARELASRWQRVGAVVVMMFLVSLFNTPARQLANDYLQEDRGYSGALISQFSLLTNAPGLIGLALAGWLTDRVSRRRVMAVGLFGAAIGDIVIFSTGGPALWIASTLGALIGGAALTGAAIIPGELFPTRLRGIANGISTASGRLGGMLGLWLAGVWSDGKDIGPAIVRLAPAQLLAAVFIFFAIPETANRTLEQLNPTDPDPDSVSTDQLPRPDGAAS